VVGIVVLAATGIGAAGTANFLSQAGSEETLLRCQVTVEAGQVVLVHAGGDETHQVDEFAVRLRNESADTRVALSLPPGFPANDGDDLFETGETALLGGVSQPTTVLLVDETDVVCRENGVGPTG
jgi:hypothetical protein